jgi:Uma2 family endonuclease
MPTVVTERPYRPVPTEPSRRRWTRAECAALERLGLWDYERLELVDGELISKVGNKRPHNIDGEPINTMGKNRRHTFTLTAIRNWLIMAFGGPYVDTEASIDVAPDDNPTSEPQPDVIVLTRASWEIRDANPQPADLRLVVEISDSTLGFDLTTKAALYPRAGIADYWVLDVQARRLIVHRDPRNGLYQSITAYRAHEAVAPLAAPDREFPVAEAFPG